MKIPLLSTICLLIISQAGCSRDSNKIIVIEQPWDKLNKFECIVKPSPENYIRSLKSEKFWNGYVVSKISDHDTVKRLMSKFSAQVISVSASSAEGFDIWTFRIKISLPETEKEKLPIIESEYAKFLEKQASKDRDKEIKMLENRLSHTTDLSLADGFRVRLANLPSRPLVHVVITESVGRLK